MNSKSLNVSVSNIFEDCDLSDELLNEDSKSREDVRESCVGKSMENSPLQNNKGHIREQASKGERLRRLNKYGSHLDNILLSPSFSAAPIAKHSTVIAKDKSPSRLLKYTKSSSAQPAYQNPSQCEVSSRRLSTTEEIRSILKFLANHKEVPERKQGDVEIKVIKEEPKREEKDMEEQYVTMKQIQHSALP